MSDQRAPALLTAADFFYGTLAAARALGRAGVSVAVADPHPLTAAAWSRHVKKRLVCPSTGNPDGFVRWLLEFGERNEKHFLYGTNDDTAWLLASHREELGKLFHLYQPSADALYSVLNKRRLHRACGRVGLEMPETWFADSLEQVERIAHDVRFPVLVKPTTQVLFRSRQKGSRAFDRDALVAGFKSFDAHSYADEITRFDESVRWPMIQSYHADAAESIYGLSGFVDEFGSAAVRASRKVLQRPRKMGVGLCFEAAQLDEELTRKVVELCKDVGYFGVFEVEFIEVAGRRLLIDFNPRFYNQMRFDCDRSLPLPLLVYHAGLGNSETLAALIAHARQGAGAGPTAYTHRFNLEILLRAQRVSGALSAEGATRWRDWLVRHQGALSDASLDRDDPVPAVVDALRLFYHYARHPRGFVRSMALDP